MPVRVILIVACCALAAAPASCAAATWGMGIDAAGMSEPLFTDLGIRQVRVVTPWDAAFHDRKRLDWWLARASAEGLEPLVAFNHSRNDLCKPPCPAPSPKRYERAMRAFHARYPWVRQVTPWNEANHGKQPTAHRPELAARYYRIARRVFRGSTIVAADVLDSHNMTRWMRRFLRAAGPRPQVVGLHNYSDVNHFRSTATDALLRMTHAKVWLTETGGVVSIRARRGDAQPSQERHAASALDYVFGLVARRPRIARAYIYEWRRTQTFDRFDAGLLRTDGTPRPGYFAVREYFTDSR